MTELEYLYMSGNSIKDISAIAKLTKLINLGLSGNEITDGSPIANLNNLNIVDLSYKIFRMPPSRGHEMAGFAAACQKLHNKCRFVGRSDRRERYD